MARLFRIAAALAAVALPAAAAFLSASCAIEALSEESVRLVLPPPHPAYLLAAPGKTPAWTVRWYGVDGSPRSEHEVTRDITLALERGVFTPVILVPETGSPGIPEGTLPVYGALYPLDCSYEDEPFTMPRVTLGSSATGGISASMAEAVCLGAKGGFDDGRTIASHFNWARFEETVSAFPEPHRIERKRFVEAVLSGSFSKRDIREPDMAEITLPASCARSSGMVSATGERFLPEWPDNPGFIRNDGGSVTCQAIEGTSRFFGGSGFLTVCITGGKLTEAFFTPYSLQD